MTRQHSPSRNPATGKAGSTGTTAKSADDGARIAKVLSRAGVASRRAAEAMIAQGRVAVNGKVIDSPALNVAPSDRITVDGAPVAAPEPLRLWLYHKPAGLVTTARDEKGRPTVFDRLPPEMPRVMPVGRLDISSEGLLLLTNDGALKRKLELPATGWLRKYRVRVNGTPDDTMLEPLRAGITVEGERFQPMRVSLDRQQGANAWLTVGLREGKNREVRRAMEAVGLVVNRLIRTGYGPFQLGDLRPGEVEEVRRRILREQLDPELAAQLEGSEGKHAPGTPQPRDKARRSTPSGKGLRTARVQPAAPKKGAQPSRSGSGAPKKAPRPAKADPADRGAQSGRRGERKPPRNPGRPSGSRS